MVCVDVGGPRSASVLMLRRRRLKGGCSGSVSNVVPADGGSGARCAGNTDGWMLYAGNVGGVTATSGA
jgi:hypothetical protein